MHNIVLNRGALARAVSILGHPLLMLPLAVLALSLTARLALQRRVPRDLVADAPAGLIAGVLFWQLLPFVAE